jgi:hypothetical protein
MLIAWGVGLARQLNPLGVALIIVYQLYGEADLIHQVDHFKHCINVDPIALTQHLRVTTHLNP